MDDPLFLNFDEPKNEYVWKKLIFKENFQQHIFSIKKTFEQRKAVDSLFNFLKKYLID
jgi:hypothetical protein